MSSFFPTKKNIAKFEMTILFVELGNEGGMEGKDWLRGVL